jgi:hypothetical protein
MQTEFWLGNPSEKVHLKDQKEDADVSQGDKLR